MAERQVVRLCPVCSARALLGINDEAACMCGWRGWWGDCVERRLPAEPCERVAGPVATGSGF